MKNIAPKGNCSLKHKLHENLSFCQITSIQHIFVHMFGTAQITYNCTNQNCTVL